MIMMGKVNEVMVPCSYAVLSSVSIKPDDVVM